MDLALNQSFFNWKLVWKPEIRDIGKTLFWENCSSWLRNLNLSDVGEGDGGGGQREERTRKKEEEDQGRRGERALQQ